MVYTSTRAGPPTMSHTDSANQEACAQLLRLYYSVGTLRRFPIYIRNMLMLRKLLFGYYCTSIHCGVMAAFIGLGRSSGIASKMCKITKCICTPEIGCLYVVWYADHEFLCFFEIQCTHMTFESYFLSEIIFQGGIQLDLPILTV